MTPQDRARLIARAKALAVPVASCVAARLRPDHLRRGLTEDEHGWRGRASRCRTRCWRLTGGTGLT